MSTGFRLGIYWASYSFVLRGFHSANEIIRNRSNATAATFIYLPAPPRLDSPHWAQTSAHYLELLTALTDELPPTVLVHGISPVTSINL